MSTLKHAISLVHKGHNDDACEILRQLVTTNKNDIYAWLWLAENSPNSDEAREAAYHVLSLRPTNQRARKLLEQMGQVALPPSHLTQYKSELGKTKRSLSVPNLAQYRWNAGLLILIFLIVISTIIFLVLGVIASERVDEQTTNDDSFLGSILESAQHNGSRNVESNESETQQVVETVGGTVLEHSIKVFAHTIKIDVVFDLLRVIDGSAEFDADDRISVTIAEQTVESPAYEDVVGIVFDGGEWLYEQIRDVVTSPFR